MNNTIESGSLNSQKALGAQPSETPKTAPVSAVDHDAGDDAGPAVSEDRLSLSGNVPSEPPSQTSIVSSSDAQRAIDRLRELIENNPDSALSAQRGLNTDTAVTALNRAAA